MAASSARRRALTRIAALAVAGLPLQVRAQHERNAAGYRTIPPQPVPPGEAIELVEFFWYGCPYCYQLQPYFTGWLVRQDHVVLRRVPAVFRPSWAPHARLYFALEQLGEVERLHQQVFESYHVARLALDSAEATADWAARHGIERERWLAAYESVEVERRVDGARMALVAYGISGTPSIVVDGRYLTSSGMTPGVAAMIPVLDQLLARVREERERTPR